MFPTTSKRLLINHIKHADTHNRIVEEQEMWKSYGKLKEKGIETDNSFLNDKREDMGVEFSYRSDRRAHMDDEPLPVAKARGKDCTFWMRQLQKVEEADPERWGHNGFKELYPNDFDSDQSDKDNKKKSKKKRKENKKKHKKSNHGNKDKKQRKSAESKHRKKFNSYKSANTSKSTDESDSDDDQGHKHKKHKRKHSDKRSHDKHHKHKRKKKSENSNRSRSPDKSGRRSRSPLGNYSVDAERQSKLSKRKRNKYRHRSRSSSRSRSPDRSRRRSRSPLHTHSNDNERHSKLSWRKRDKYRHRSRSSSSSSNTSSSSEMEDRHYIKYKTEMKKLADYVSNGGLIVTKNRHRKVPKRTSQNSSDFEHHSNGDKYFTVSDSEGERDSF